jgi:hypothetical protein
MSIEEPLECKHTRAPIVEPGGYPRQAPAGGADAFADVPGPQPLGRTRGQAAGIAQGVFAEVDVGASGQGVGQTQEVLRQAPSEGPGGVEVFVREAAQASIGARRPVQADLRGRIGLPVEPGEGRLTRSSMAPATAPSNSPPPAPPPPTVQANKAARAWTQGLPGSAPQPQVETNRPSGSWAISRATNSSVSSSSTLAQRWPASRFRSVTRLSLQWRNPERNGSAGARAWS